MGFLKVYVFFTLLSVVLCKGNTQRKSALTEVGGQEVIEIGAPIKDLPPDMEEEPAAENDIEDMKSAASTSKPTTKKENKKLNVATTFGPVVANKVKGVNKIDGVKMEDEEAKIERALSELYKDNADYKADNSAEVREVKQSPSTVTVASTTTSDLSEDDVKPSRRGGNSQFQFQPPNMKDKAAVERFRTSIDEISCDKAKLSGVTEEPIKLSAWSSSANVFMLLSAAILHLLQ